MSEGVPLCLSGWIDGESVATVGSDDGDKQSSVDKVCENQNGFLRRQLGRRWIRIVLGKD